MLLPNQDSTKFNQQQNNQKRRGRPCAVERYNNELMQQKLVNLINSTDEYTKLSIMPIVVNRQRRVRANVREKNRMQTLNQALNVLKKHLPIDLLLNYQSSHDTDDNNMTICTTKTSSSMSALKRKSLEHKLTKIDTLKLATKYVSILTDLLNDQHGKIDSKKIPINSFSNNNYTSSLSSTPSSSPSYISTSTPSSTVSSSSSICQQQVKKLTAINKNQNSSIQTTNDFNQLYFNNKANSNNIINNQNSIQSFNSCFNSSLTTNNYNHNNNYYYFNINNSNNNNEDQSKQNYYNNYYHYHHHNQQYNNQF